MNEAKKVLIDSEMHHKLKCYSAVQGKSMKEVIDELVANIDFEFIDSVEIDMSNILK